MWSPQQRQRLGIEKTVLEAQKLRVTWYNPTSRGNTFLEWETTTNSGNRYTLRVYLGADFPMDPPKLVVAYPANITGYRGANLHNCSAHNHTYSPIDGCVQICHYRHWGPERTLANLFLKGRIWLEALEENKATGKALDKLLAEDH